MPRSETSRAFFSVALDLIMLGLIIANLALIVFDWMFLNATFQALLHQYVPRFYTFYNQTIHANFFYIDLVFVGIFVLEIVIRWGLAIARQTYYRWWVYPFVHWYDVLGCIPISSFRTLRLLRVFAVIPKAQRLGIVDLKETYLYGRYLRFREIIVEEITDRVTVNILEGMQEGIQQGHPVTERIVRDVIEPKQEALFSAVAHRIQESVASSYAPHRNELQAYVEERVADAVDDNKEIKALARIPGVGRPLSTVMERAISDIVFHVVDDVLHDMASPDNDALVAEITATSANTLARPQFDPRLNRLLQEIILESLDLIKEQVEIKQWKLEAVAEGEVGYDPDQESLQHAH